MSYTSEVSDVFRTYSIILEEGIPSILSLVNKGRNRSLITIQNDKSVSVTRSLGDKVIDCLERQEELKSHFKTVNNVLDLIDSSFKQLLTEYYCNLKSMSDALVLAGFKSQAAMDYAKALFAYHHPDISLSEQEFKKICADLSESVDQAVKNEISIRESFSVFKNNVISTPDSFLELASELEQIDPENPNSNYLRECSSGNVKFWRRRNQLLLVMFYASNPDIDFELILDLLKEGQGQKKYIQRLHKKLHPEQF